jgi:AcrR family transcriptional regulator
MTPSTSAPRRRTAAVDKYPRVTKRRAETRAKLLEAAYRVFADKGFGKVRIDDVCTAAGYTRGAFYSQFDSLEGLFFTLYDERATIIAEQVAEAVLADAKTDDVGAAIERVSATLLLDRDWLLIKTDFLMYAARNPAVAESLGAHRSQLRAAVEQRLRAMSNDLQLPHAIGDISSAARAVVAAYDGVATQLLLDGDLPAARAWLYQLLTTLLKR